jgi:hypothetical protein
MVPPSSRRNPGVVIGKLAYRKRRIASCNSLATMEGIMPTARRYGQPQPLWPQQRVHACVVTKDCEYGDRATIHTQRSSLSRVAAPEHPGPSTCRPPNRRIPAYGLSALRAYLDMGHTSCVMSVRAKSPPLCSSGWPFVRPSA